MSNPAESFTDADYPPVPCNCLDSLISAPIASHWLCGGDTAVCATHVGAGVFCTGCGHESDCHETVRFEL